MSATDIDDDKAAPQSDTAFSPWLSQAAILVVDDEPGMRNFLLRALTPRCARVEVAADTAAAARLLNASHFDLVILDNIMSGRRGLEWLDELRRDGFPTEVILITAFADLETAIAALRAGAADFVLKPFRTNQILNAIARCLDRAELRRENFVLRRALPRMSAEAGRLVGRSPQIQQLREIVARVAALPTTVLITGESGTGKEVTARALHDASRRAGKPFVPVNCAAIAPDIIESELFGHVKGAFTGAVADRPGCFKAADGGVLLLDEIGDMALEVQAKLLRVLQEGEVTPVGSHCPQKVDVRVVAATHRDLAQAVRDGRFREDLRYRLDVLSVRLPPLRERLADIVPLAEHFLRLAAAPGPAKRLSAEAARALLAYDWPGNVRELRNAMERCHALQRGAVIAQVELPGAGSVGNAAEGIGGLPADWYDGTLPEAVERLEKLLLQHALAAAGGNRSMAARQLGIHRQLLYTKLAQYGLE